MHGMLGQKHHTEVRPANMPQAAHAAANHAPDEACMELSWQEHG